MAEQHAFGEFPLHREIGVGPPAGVGIGDDRSRAINGLVDFQTGDYSALFSTMKGLPVTVRLFDPPLHEFLPRTDEDIEETAASLGLAVRALRLRLERIAEVNPMLGHRGVRLAITYPEMLQMQMQAIMAGVRAASETQNEPVAVEVMVPFVSTASEVALVRERVQRHRGQFGPAAHRTGRASPSAP